MHVVYMCGTIDRHKIIIKIIFLLKLLLSRGKR